MAKSINIEKNIQTAYDEFYSDELTEWREIGGKVKAQNILEVCKDMNFNKVLECGAGEGSILKYLDLSDKFQKLYAIEISDSGVSQIKKRKLDKLKEVKKFDGYEIPYQDNEFDMVYCSHVMEHVEHPRILLRELKRVSKHQVFEVPLDYSTDVDKKIKDYLSYGHINIYTPSLFRFLIKSEGFHVINDLLTHADTEVLRFNCYKNLKLKKTLYRELKFALTPLTHFLRRLKNGKYHKENCYSAYTCLCKADSEIRIF